MQSVFKALALFCFLCAFAANCLGIDREAFSFTNYDLSVRIEPEQHRLGARGKITLRNDTASPQKMAVLQISSSLDWRSIKVADKAVHFVTQPYTSDVDHTGALSEAIVTLPEPVAPHAAVELEIAYEGVILRDATRLTRIGTPDEIAKNTDWDQIDTNFTALRGAGYVAWYPIAAEVVDLSEGDSLFEVLARWKAREAGVEMKINFSDSFVIDDPPWTMVCSGDGIQAVTKEGTAKFAWASCLYPNVGRSAPSFAIAKYERLDRPSITVFNLPAHAAAGEAYADSAEKVVILISEWFGKTRHKARTADLPDEKAAPFESGSVLFTPLAGIDPKLAGLSAAYQLTHAAFSSQRPWIDEGLAHFAQALYIEQEKGRQAAIEYMGLHRSAFSNSENRSTPPRSEDEVDRSLVNTTDEQLYRSKAMCVWWMLRDMVGDAALKKALATYRPEQDKEPSYIQRLIAAESPRDLEWFFDDWVYRDRGLPEFKVESVFPRKTMTGTFLVTVTVDNLGTAGAEVPLTVKFAGGGVTKKLEVRAKSKGTIRIEIPAMPQEVVVNDGSVPEHDMTNNIFKLEAPSGPTSP